MDVCALVVKWGLGLDAWCRDRLRLAQAPARSTRRCSRSRRGGSCACFAGAASIKREESMRKRIEEVRKRQAWR